MGNTCSGRGAVHTWRVWSSCVTELLDQSVDRFSRSHLWLVYLYERACFGHRIQCANGCETAREKSQGCHLLCSERIFFSLSWMASLTPLLNFCLLCPECVHYCPRNSVPDVWTAESWPEELALLCCAMCLWSRCLVSPLQRSGHSWLHCTVYPTPLSCSCG